MNDSRAASATRTVYADEGEAFSGMGMADLTRARRELEHVRLFQRCGTGNR
jgi:hypothetical protein